MIERYLSILVYQWSMVFIVMKTTLIRCYENQSTPVIIIARIMRSIDDNECIPCVSGARHNEWSEL